MPNIKELEQRLHRLDKEKASVKHQLSQVKRKGDTKRKILYGAAALTLASQDVLLQDRLERYLDLTVKRPDDRALLGLPEKLGLDEVA
jgi:hypothetical protein